MQNNSRSVGYGKALAAASLIWPLLSGLALWLGSQMGYIHEVKITLATVFFMTFACAGYRYQMYKNTPHLVPIGQPVFFGALATVAFAMVLVSTQLQ